MTLAALLALVVTLTIGAIGPVLLLPILRRLGVIDIPNHRSSHTAPVVRGGGVAPWLALATGLAILISSKAVPTEFFAIGFVALAAGCIGWIEDHKGLAVRSRAGMQLAIGAVGVGWMAMNSGTNFGFVALGAIFVAGYINVANFMDGINGISGFHALVAGGLLASVGYLSDRDWLTVGGLLIAAAFVGFLILNVNGRLFLGDVGSYLLGGAVSILVIAALFDGVGLMAALAPTLVYLTDTSTTLFKRIRNGERWFEAHRSHVYQRLTNLGLTHLQVAGTVSLFTAVSGAACVVTILASDGIWFAACALVILCALCGYVSLPWLLASRRHNSISQGRNR